MEDLGLRALTVVSTVASHRSFRGAADELGLSPSSVSHMVANLEEKLGLRLFLRSTRSVAITEAGEAFLRRIRPALAEITEAVQDVHAFRDKPAGQIRLTASVWAADRILPIVTAFSRLYPDIGFDIVTDGRIIVGAPAYFAERGTPASPGDLLAHDCIRARLPSGTIMRWEMQRSGEEVTVDVKGRIIVGTTELSAKAAAQGAGIAYVEAREAQALLASGALIRVLDDWTQPFEGLALYYPRQRLPSAAFRAFVDFYKARTAEYRRS
jgi:DNA-binding transcriptional LysR family regulator